MSKKVIAPTRTAADALAVLGAQIRLARHEKNWTAAELGMRIGVGRHTVTAIERGEPGVAIGTVLNAASVLGVALFGADNHELARLRRRGEERLALLPSREDQPRSIATDGDHDLNF
ncbi:helix-turn-helix transcriptional regulator [Mycobacterium montefiorense]|uniref:HTH cro/C1-type domain-containing protein n=1 Tax=Mycobacterium montefiorense TaxID=154654 RepID=A0AA37PS99_9MYCO|nr:helix-turn-helix domain-containing protein [Mycobacterium montefiorense]GBG36768.1 hypothetical protein MmonteBS_11400 [Mycobacterium montefiorense]GKU37528.1 hypothetical protein NJB14191_48740 [Mycobacterium montefiorense]GKU42604.1 hypothetical protein NJB14192_45870 [Mycobacterium montefiorense]GKU48718.1 hypothetical protein NJB14194_53330 [Mycobacterium montefiorense]GKU50743.1 hypothetical protein NJB14195_19890 [Mycobacterium montefiorense]